MSYIKPGTLVNPFGKTVSFGKHESVMHVNDRIGYEIEKPEIIAALLDEDFTGLINIAQDGVKLETFVVNLQLMRVEIDERKLLPRLLEKLMPFEDLFVALDTRDADLLETCLRIYGPAKALCNVVNGETENLKRFLPVIAKYGGAVGTSLVDEKGIPDNVADRVHVAKRIVNAAEANGIAKGDVAIDCVCLPAGVVQNGVKLAFETMRAVREELDVPLLLGVSNISYLMPNPEMIEAVFNIMCAAMGLDVAMVNPFTPDFVWHKKTADFLTGADTYAQSYIEYFRLHSI